jgi:1-acyl-sn-glycerol-3-phosphate acyltransferase
MTEIKRYLGKFIVVFTAQFWLLYYYVICRGKVNGVENIPKGACILAYNHVSFLDWIIGYSLFLLVYRKKIYFIGKSGLLKNWLWKYYLIGSDTIIIDYSSKESFRNVSKSIKERLSKGDRIGIFPEGTRSPDGKLQKAEEGMAHFILQTNVPVVPVGLKGFYEAWPKHKKMPGIARCSINIGKPISFSKSDNENVKTSKSLITMTVMNEIAKLSGNE